VLRAARECFPHRHIWAVFQPHTYSRTRAFLDAFAGSFGDADDVIVTDIYAAREKDDGSVHARDVAERIRDAHAHYIGRLDEAVHFLEERVRPGDVVLTLGAGDGDRVGTDLLARLRRRQGERGESFP